MKKKVQKVIEKWFKSKGGGGLILPDGWFGRPYDNFHQLQGVEICGDGLLVIVLDNGKLNLCFEGEVSVSTSKLELKLTGFEVFTFNWEEYASTVRHVQKYNLGEVKIVTPPGA